MKVRETLTYGYPLPLMPKGERKMERREVDERGSMSCCMSVAINDKGGDCWKLLIKLSLMPIEDLLAT